MATRRWLIARQIGENYQLSKKRLKWLREEGLITFRLEGNRFLYLQESIENYLNDGASEATPQKASVEKMVLSPTEEKIQRGGNKVKWKNGKTIRINLGDFSLIESKGTSGLVYYIDYFDGKSRRTKNLGKLAKQFRIDRGIIADRKAAEVMGRKVRNALYEQEESEDTSAKDITFAEFAERYLEKKKNKNSNSLKTVRSAIVGSLIPYFGEVKLSELNLERTFKYVESLRDNDPPIKDSTIGNYLTVFGSLISFAERYDYPVKRKKKIIHRSDYDLEPTKRERELESDEQIALFKVANSFWKDLLNFALFTGLRLGNICNLKWTSVDFEAQMIRILSAESKNNEPIEIFMNPTVVELLKRMHKANGEHTHVFMRPKNGNNKQILKERWVQVEFKELTKKVEIDDLHFHDLRRTFAMRLVRKGIDLLTLKKCMSHKSINSTMCYIKEDPKAVKRAFESLDQDFRENEFHA